MAAYCGSIGSINVLEFVSTDLFDESQENPFLLQQQCGGSAMSSPLTSSPPLSPLTKHQSVRFAELPLNDQCDAAERSDEGMSRTVPSPTKSTLWTSPSKRPSSAMPSQPSPVRGASVVVPTPVPHPPVATTSLGSPPGSPMANRQSITISLPYTMFHRQNSSDSLASTTPTQADQDASTVEETELHKLLYSLSRLAIGQPLSENVPAGSPSFVQQQQEHQQPLHLDEQFSHSYAPPVSAPTSPTVYSSSSMWLPVSPRSQDLTHAAPTTNMDTSVEPPAGTASLMFRSMNRQSRRMSGRKSILKRFSSAPNSPTQTGSYNQSHANDRFFPDESTGGGHAEYAGSQPTSPHNSRGSVTFLTVKNLLRGGGALARTVYHEQAHRRPTCMGKELTISSRLKQRQKFQRPTVITDAYHRVSDMKLGTSPMKVKIKHIAFPQATATDNLDLQAQEVDPGMPSPKGQLRRESLITLETLDKIGTRHACPVQLIEEPLPDFSMIQPRVDAWNHYKKPKKTLRRPSAWLLGATATSTPHGANQ